jgi:16S rRNA U516 pseudouridylate synthase RsuA-like enzyme
MFAGVGAPIDRLVRVRIGPVRIDGLASGRTRPLKAPEVRGLGSGAGRSRDEIPVGSRGGSRRR